MYIISKWTEQNHLFERFCYGTGTKCSDNGDPFVLNKFKCTEEAALSAKDASPLFLRKIALGILKT